MSSSNSNNSSNSNFNDNLNSVLLMVRSHRMLLTPPLTTDSAATASDTNEYTHLQVNIDGGDDYNENNNENENFGVVINREDEELEGLVASFWRRTSTWSDERASTTSFSG